MTKDEAIKILPDMKGAGSEWDKAIDLAIEALKAQLTEKDTTSDCISRRDAIEWCLEGLNNMPSAQPEIVQCKDCRWQKDQSGSTAWLPCRVLVTPDDFYCGNAERKTDG